MDGLLNKFSGNKDAGQAPAPPHEPAQAQKQEGGGGGFMEKLGGMVGGNKKAEEVKVPEKQGGGGLMDKFNSMAGGGQTGEQKEDALDKAIDFVQEHGFGQGKQNNESAFEQQKDEFLSDSIRKQYKAATGKEFPVADKS